MIQISRWSPALAAVCLTVACSDSRSALAPAESPGLSAEVTATACEAELNALRAAIGAAEFTGKNGERERDIRSTVSALSTPDAKGKTKLSAVGADGISAAVTDAENCVRSLGLQEPI
jgi:hypothetical protein